MNKEQLFSSLLVLNTEAGAKTIQAVATVQIQGIKAGVESLVLTVGESIALQIILLGALGFKSEDVRELINKSTAELKETYKEVFESASTEEESPT